jgi:transcriptional regulator GlxA family with amidase domain
MTFFKLILSIMKFIVFVLSGAYASSVSVTLDMLTAAAQIAPRMGLPVPQWKVCALDSKVSLSNGMQLTAEPMRRSPQDGALQHFIVPGLGLSDPVTVASRLQEPDVQQAAKLLAKAASRGAHIHASCTATLLLASAGLLQGKQATTTWWLSAELRRIEPSCTVDTRRLIVHDGRITTAGAALAQADLMLHLLKTYYKLELANAVARVMLLDQRQAQASYIVPAAYMSGDELVSRLSRRLEAALPEPPSMEELATEFKLSTRTLARRVQAATGRGPLALLQTLRIHKAQALLANSCYSVDEVAQRVGYTDATALRRLMKQSLHSTPRQLRTAAS